MGRIGDCNPHLVDVRTAQAILKKSRRTVFYLMKLGHLSPTHIPGSKKTWFEVSEVVRLSQVHQPLRCPKKMTPWLEQHFRRFHPQLFDQSSQDPTPDVVPAIE